MPEVTVTDTSCVRGQIPTWSINLSEPAAPNRTAGHTSSRCLSRGSPTKVYLLSLVQKCSTCMKSNEGAVYPYGRWSDAACSYGVYIRHYWEVQKYTCRHGRMKVFVICPRRPAQGPMSNHHVEQPIGHPTCWNLI